MPFQPGVVFWLLTRLAKLMLISVKPFDGVIMAMLNCCLNYFMMQIWSCLEVCCAARTVFISYFHRWSLSQWNSELHIALLFSPIAIIVSTNIHLFYDVYLIEHTDCQAVKLLVFVACVCCFCFYLLVLFIVCSISFHFNFHFKLSYSLYAVFLCYLMAFDCQELKGLLTYLLTYLTLQCWDGRPWPMKILAYILNKTWKVVVSHHSPVK